MLLMSLPQSRQHRDPNQPPHTSSNKRRHSPSYRNNGRASQRQKVDKPDAPFYGLFRGVENCIEQLVTLETLSTILDHEWPEEMKVTSVYRVLKSTVISGHARLFARYERASLAGEHALPAADSNLGSDCDCCNAQR